MSTGKAIINGEQCNFTQTNGNVDVQLGDQHTPPIDSLFAKEVSSFSLTASTSVSLKTTLSYQLTAAAGHNITSTSEVLLLDTAANRSFFAGVVTATTSTITVDRPIDHSFPVASLGRRVSTNMAVVGTTTPQIYTVRAGRVPVDITRIIIAITDSTAMDDGKFGGIAALPKGIVFRILNSYQKTIFCFKTNGEIKQMAFDGNYQTGVSGPLGTESFISRITFAGTEKHGVVLRVADDDVLQIIVQDDLSALGSLKVSAQGHETEGVT